MTIVLLSYQPLDMQWKMGKIILMSHLGRVKTEEDLAENTLLPVAKRLSELLNKEVILYQNTW